MKNWKTLKKSNSNRTKHLEDKTKVTDLSKNVSRISIKGYDFLLGIVYFAGDDGYQTFLAFSLILNLLTVNNNNDKEVTSLIFIGISPENMVQF